MEPNYLKGRPIVAGPNSPMQTLSSLTEKILKPIVPCLTTYIKDDKDDWHFIKQLLRTLNYEATLYSCDIKLIDYGDIAYDQPNKQSFSNKIEVVQYNAALAIINAIKGTSRTKLHKELGIEPLSFR